MAANSSAVGMSEPRGERRGERWWVEGRERRAAASRRSSSSVGLGRGGGRRAKESNGLDSPERELRSAIGYAVRRDDERSSRTGDERRGA